MVEEEREIWKHERMMLRQEIEQLKAQLSMAHSPSGKNGQPHNGEVRELYCFQAFLYNACSIAKAHC